VSSFSRILYNLKMADDQAQIPMSSFADLDDLGLFHILNFVATKDLLGCALLSSVVRDVARSGNLWVSRLESLRIRYPLGFPASLDGANGGDHRRSSSRTLQLPFLHPMARLSEKALQKLPVKQLKALASSLDVSAHGWTDRRFDELIHVYRHSPCGKL